jgi:hypothetical protein
VVEKLAALDDPCCPGKVEHRLGDVLVGAVCAVVARARILEDVALHGPWPVQAGLAVGLPRPAGPDPLGYTFHHVPMLVDPDTLEHCSLASVRTADEAGRDLAVLACRAAPMIC